MNNSLIQEMADRILMIERESIKKRKNVVSQNTAKFGTNKADTDVVKDILKILEDGGIGNEDTSN